MSLWRGKYSARIFPFREQIRREILRKSCVKKQIQSSTDFILPATVNTKSDLIYLVGRKPGDILDSMTLSI